MANPSSFLAETAETASFAFREYFRPVVAIVRFVRVMSTPLAHRPVAKSPRQVLCRAASGRQGIFASGEDFSGDGSGGSA